LDPRQRGAHSRNQEQESKVNNAAFTPDGQRLVTDSSDKAARVWNASNGQLIAKLNGNYAVSSPDGQRILTTSDDKTALVWDATSGQLISKLQVPAKGLPLAEFSLDGHRSNGASHGRPLAEFSPDGMRLVTESADGTVRIWNAANGQLITNLPSQKGVVNNVAFAPDSQCFVTSNSDRTLLVWNAANGQIIANLKGQIGTFSAFSPDSQHVVTNDDKVVRIWNAAKGQVIANLPGRDAVFSPDGQHIITRGPPFSPLLQVFAASGELIAKLGSVNYFGFSLDGQRIVTARTAINDGTGYIWNASNGQLIAELHGHTSAIMGAAFSPDGRRVVTASPLDNARVWSALDGQLVARLEGQHGIRDAVFSRDGQRILTTSNLGTARIWKIFTIDNVAAILN